MSRILVADDHPFFRMGVDAVLRAEGHDVVAMADDGETTLGAVERENPDIVLLDVRMPGKDGISTLQALRKRGDNRPVILLTVEMTADQLLAAIKAGVSGIVFKHDAEETLIKAINAVSAGLQFIRTDLVNQAIEHADRSSRPSRLAPLTPKELVVVRQVARGLRNREIAEVLKTTEGTVKVFLHSIYRKLSISNRTELTRIALDEESF